MKLNRNRSITFKLPHGGSLHIDHLIIPIMTPKQKPRNVARQIVESTSEDRRWIKRLRKLGASDHEISKALGIPFESACLKGP